MGAAAAAQGGGGSGGSSAGAHQRRFGAAPGALSLSICLFHCVGPQEARRESCRARRRRASTVRASAVSHTKL